MSNAEGKPEMDQCSIQGLVKLLLAASCYRNRDKLQPDEPLELDATQFPNYAGWHQYTLHNLE